MRLNSPAWLARRKHRRGWVAAAACAAAVALGGSTLATELPATLPHVLFRGPPAGPAAMLGADWHRANRSDSLAGAATLGVVWQRRVSAGISCNVLVDARGRIFVAAAGHVTELGFDGQVAYRKLGEFPECLAAALLADGSRVVLGAGGTLSGWSRLGAGRLELTLDAPARFNHSTLLPLPDGGVLASLGARLFDVSPEGELRAHRQLAHDVVQSLVLDERRVVVVDAAGEISEWHGRSPPRRLGTFGATVATAAASDSTTLIGLASRSAIAFSLEQREPKALLSFDRTGVLPLISVPAAGDPLFLRADGSIERAGGTPLPRSGSGLEPLRNAQLLTGRDGAVVWLAANVPLEVVAEAEPPRAVPEVICAEPVSLVPAAGGHVVVACRTGQLWRLGPVAREGASPVRPD